MHPFQTASKPVVIGHRGAPRRATENTTPAFAAAAEDGATWIELDARLSADGIVVVHHDPHTSAGVAVIDQAAEALTARGVETLCAVLSALPQGIGVDVECKNLFGEPDYDDDQALAAAVVQTLGPWVRRLPLLVSSFNPLTVQALASGLPEVPAGLLYGDRLQIGSALKMAAEVGAVVLAPHVDSIIGPAEVAAAHEAGLGLMVWPVDDPVRARDLAGAGVDALCTNDPAGIVRALGRPV